MGSMELNDRNKRKTRHLGSKETGAWLNNSIYKKYLEVLEQSKQGQVIESGQ